MNRYKLSPFVLFPFILMLHNSCKKAVEVSAPVTELTGSTIFKNNNTAISAMTAIYDNLSTDNGLSSGGTSGISFDAGLSADELTEYYPNISLMQLYTNSLVSSTPPPFWDGLYQYIYYCNSVLEGLSNSSNVLDGVKQQLTGEAKFMRAFLYFYAVNLYGDVPLILSTNYATNAKASRTAKSLVYQQIIADLTAAQSLLSTNFVSSDVLTTSSERVRPSKWAATALLARTYLYTEKYDSAQLEATTVISNNSTFYLVTGLDSVFLANSAEAIWQLQPVIPSYNSNDGFAFILTDAPFNSSNTPAAVSPQLLSSFESGDLRRLHWIEDTTFYGVIYSFPYKYKVRGGIAGIAVTEYTMMLRVAEMYLIRAEAEVQQKDLADAAADLNTIRARAGLSATTEAGSQTTLLAAILHERQVELFTEWGHRWFDLNRTGNVNAVMGAPGNVCQMKGGSWSPNWTLYPVPQSETINDPNLSQNNGYN